MIDRNHGWNVSYKPLFLGLILSIIFSFAMYRAADKQHLSGDILFIVIFGLALLQTVVQLVLFMQIGLEKKPHWNSISIFFTLLVIIIIVGGSIWIMNNLNYNLMPSMKNMPTHGSF